MVKKEMVKNEFFNTPTLEQLKAQCDYYNSIREIRQIIYDVRHGKENKK